MYRHRTIERCLQEMINAFPVIMLSGPRQVGKTTLLNYLAQQTTEKWNFVTFDDLNLRTQAIEEPELFLMNQRTPLVIDEFQYAPNLLSYIKIIVDKARTNELFGDKQEVGTLFYLTGSQVFQTMAVVSESLAGRVAILDLYGFSSREMNGLLEDIFVPKIENLKARTRAKRLSSYDIFERIFHGSFPELHNKPHIGVKKFYETYVRTYLERDIRQIIKVKDELKFLKFISSVAARTSQEYNASNIASDVDIDSKTVDHWMSVLKNTGLVYLLQPYFNNQVARAIKRPKICFMDTGLACYLTGYTDIKTLELGAYNGAIFETYLISEIIKSFSNNGLDPRKYLYYYRDHNGCEIDLLVLYDHIIYPVEIKKSANPQKSSIKNFKVIEKFAMDCGNGIVLCLMEDIFALDSNNYCVPIEYI